MINCEIDYILERLRSLRSIQIYKIFEIDFSIRNIIEIDSDIDGNR